MRKWMAWLLALTLLLSGCGKSADSPKQDTEAETVPGVDSKTGTWIGSGGCYKLSDAKYPKNCELSFPYKGQRCYVIQGMMESRILLGERELACPEGMVGGADAGEDGIWYCIEQRGEDGCMTETMILVNEAGEEQKRLELRFPKDCFPRRFAVTDGCFCFNCSDRLRIYDESGSPLHDIPHEEWKGKLVKSSSGGICFVEEWESGGSVSRVNIETGELEPLFDYPRGSVCTGDGESPLLLMCPEGIYHLDENGETAPLVVWEECGLALSGLMYVESEPDGSYLLRGSSFDALRLSPAEPSELKPRVRLKLGMMGMNGELPHAVAAFNARSTDCCVELVDLKDGGLSDEDALMRLNTLLAAGEGPDMLAFGNGVLTPFPFLRKGMLRDLETDLAADGDIDPEKLLIAQPIKKDCGGLYLLASGFSLETRLGLRETFGDAKGWSFDEYQALARITPSDRMVMYNLTRDYFLTESVSRYLRKAIDWQSGSCDFDNPEFCRVLEAVRDVVETPEDLNNMVFGTNLMADGYMATELALVNHVTALARNTRTIGKPVSIIGFPTPDGSCGTDMGLQAAVGVLSSSKHPEACLAFLKDWLLHPNQIPSYQPLFEAAVEEYMRKDETEQDELFSQRLNPPLTAEEAQQLRELIAAVEHTTLYDRTAMDIIRQEAAAFLAGQRSAEETARLVQSRVSLYVSEQS